MSKLRGCKRKAGLAGLCLLLTAMPAPANPAGEVQVTLAEAIDRASAAAPEMVQAQGEVQAARASQRTAFGAFLPSVSLSAATGLASSGPIDPGTNTSITGSNGSYGAGVSASWDVFTGLRRGAQQDRAAANTEQAQARLEGQYFSVALAVQRAFYEGLRGDELASVARSRIGRAQQGVEVAKQKMAAGNATRSDLLRAQLELSTARESLLQAQTQGSAARLELGRLMGIPAPARPRLTEALAIRPLALERAALLEVVVGQSPAVRAAVATLAAGEASIRVSRAGYFPTARLSAGYDVLNPQLDRFADGRSSWSVRLGLSFPVFDGFVREEAMERSRIQANTARAQLANAERAARSATEQALQQLQLQEDRIELAGGAVEVAREDLRVQEERYRLGVTTMLDLLTSQASLVQAENDLVSARFDYQLARASLEALAGRAL